MSRKAWVVLAALALLWLSLVAAGTALAVAAVSRGRGGWEEERVIGDGPRKVVLIRVSGEITDGESEDVPGREVAGARDLLDQIRQASEDDAVEAVVLRLETPGGAVVASDEVYRALRRLDRDKPVVASMGDIAASGGYYLASAARRIVANPSTLTGSIGVIAIFPNLRGTAEKLGIEPVVLKSGRLKDAGSPFGELTPEERDLFQRLLDEAHEQFIRAVAEGRHRPVDEIRPLADGRVFSGQQAKANGLVDELGDLETAYDAALRAARLDREDARLVAYRRRESLSNLLRLPFLRSPVSEVRRELGLGFGLKYLFVP